MLGSRDVCSRAGTRVRCGETRLLPLPAASESLLRLPSILPAYQAENHNPRGLPTGDDRRQRQAAREYTPASQKRPRNLDPRGVAMAVPTRHCATRRH
jgi:hypothetical protein